MTHCPPFLHPVKLFASSLLISVHLLLFFFFMRLLLPHCLFLFPLLHLFWLCSSSCTLLCLLRRLPFFHPLLSHHSALPLLLSFYLCIFSSTLLLFLLLSLPCPFSAAITTHSFNLLPDAEQWGGRDGGDFWLRLSAQLLNLGHGQYLSCLCFPFPTRLPPTSPSGFYEVRGCTASGGRWAPSYFVVKKHTWMYWRMKHLRCSAPHSHEHPDCSAYPNNSFHQ